MPDNIEAELEQALGRLKQLRAKVARLAQLEEAARAWRRMRNFTYQPGEINPHLLTAHQEDLDLAAAVDALTPPSTFSPEVR